MLVSTSAFWMASGLVLPARLIASASAIRPVKVRAELPLKFVLYRSRYRSLTCLISGFLLARSSAQTSRLRTYSPSFPSVFRNSESLKPASLASSASGETPSSLYVFIERIASPRYDDCMIRSGLAALIR